MKRCLIIQIHCALKSNWLRGGKEEGWVCNPACDKSPIISREALKEFIKSRDCHETSSQKWVKDKKLGESEKQYGLVDSRGTC